MKTAKKYIKDFWGDVKNGRTKDGRCISIYDVELVINAAINEAYNQAIDDAVENVRLINITDSPNNNYDDINTIGNDMGDVYAIDKNSILKLKK